jgi:hypothetical protein
MIEASQLVSTAHPKAVETQLHHLLFCGVD